MKKRLLRLLAFLTVSVFCINNAGIVWATPSIPKPVTTIPVLGLGLTPNNRVMAIGSTLDLFLTINPSNATNKSVTWSTSNSNVATVTSAGRVTAVGYGNATIIVRSSNGRSASSYITVKNSNSEEATTTEVKTIESTAPKTTTEATTQQSTTTSNIGNRSDYYTTQQPVYDSWSSANGQQAEQNNKDFVMEDSIKKGDVLSTSNFLFEVTDTNKRTVSCVQYQGKKKTKIVIPASVSYKGVRYKVTQIDKFAFKNNKKVKKVVIGKNVRVIGEQAFYGCKSLKQVYIYSEKLTKVGSRAFKNTGKKLVFSVPKGKMKKYKKLLG